MDIGGANDVLLCRMDCIAVVVVFAAGVTLTAGCGGAVGRTAAGSDVTSDARTSSRAGLANTKLVLVVRMMGKTKLQSSIFNCFDPKRHLPYWACA